VRRAKQKKPNRPATEVTAKRISDSLHCDPRIQPRTEQSIQARKENRLENYLGKLVLRLTLGGLLLLHGVAKIYTGPASIMERVARVGVPSALGYLVYAGEVLAPLLLIAGLWTRAAGLLVAINMVVAVLLVHTDQLGALNRNGGWALELQGFYFLTAVTIMLLGPGKLSIDDIRKGELTRAGFPRGDLDNYVERSGP